LLCSARRPHLDLSSKGSPGSIVPVVIHSEYIFSASFRTCASRPVRQRNLAKREIRAGSAVFGPLVLLFFFRVILASFPHFRPRPLLTHPLLLTPVPNPDMPRTSSSPSQQCYVAIAHASIPAVSVLGVIRCVSVRSRGPDHRWTNGETSQETSIIPGTVHS